MASRKWVSEFHEKKNKKKITHGRRPKQKQKNLPRTNTEGSRDTEGKPSRSRKICLGWTRKNTEGSRSICHGNKTLLSDPDAWATVLSCGGEHNFLLHIFTSLKRKRRFLKCPFYTHILFLRLRFRLVRQEIPLRVGFQIRRSLWTKEHWAPSTSSGTGFRYGRWACRTGRWYQIINLVHLILRCNI